MSPITQGAAGGLSYLERAGGGAPIVLLHGIGSNARSFVPMIEALNVPRRVLAWDAPGYGESRPLPVEWPDATDYAMALNRLLARLGITRCVLVGHSLGTLVAARCARLLPERVAGLCLISPSLGGGAQKGAPLPPGVAERIEQLDRLGAEQFAAARAPLLLADPAAHPDVLQSVMRAMASIRRPGYDQAARMLATAGMLDDAAKITAPTVVVVGAQDRITPPKNARRVFEALPASARREFFEIPDAGHAVCQEHPAAVARVIAAIVDHKAIVHA
jgi:pimeloyl-ACP methyl ester carboxylesterase